MVSTAIQELASLDRVIHEPARLMIMTVLFAVEEADFLYLRRECGLTQGNLSSHLTRLQTAGYLSIQKALKGKYPLTILRLTRTGRQTYQSYLRKISAVAMSAPRKLSRRG